MEGFIKEGKYHIKRGFATTNQFWEILNNENCYSINLTNKGKLDSWYAKDEFFIINLRMWESISLSSTVERLVMKDQEPFFKISVECLSQNKSITYLDISGTQTEGWLPIILQGMKQLEVLVIIGCRLNDVEENALRLYPNLKVIRREADGFLKPKECKRLTLVDLLSDKGELPFFLK